MALTIDFAFEGFRVIREKPRLIVIWGIARLLLMAALGVPLFYALKTYGPQIQQLVTGLEAKDPQVILGMVGSFIAAYIGFIILALLVSSVFYCAVFRAAYREPREGLGYLRFGADELRQVGVLLLLFLVIIAVYIGIIIVVAGGAVAIGIGGGGNGGGAIAVIAAVLGVIALIVGVIWISVRMSLFQVQTFATRKVNLFGSLALTKGNFWTLLGGYLVAAILAMLVSLLASIIISVIVGLVTGSMQTNPFASFGVPGAASPKTINEFLEIFTTPAFLISTALQELLAAPLLMAVGMAPSVAAYRVLAGETTLSAEKVF